MKRILFFIFGAVLFCGCNHQTKQVKLQSEEMQAVDATRDANADTVYINRLKPIKEALNEQLDVVIGYAPEALLVHKPECKMLNWASDALYDMSYIVRTEPAADFAVVNMGGMRCEWQAGNITRRSIYELMPFDNKLVVLTITGKDVLELCDIFAFQGGQGVSKQLRMEMKNQKAQNVLLNGKPIVEDALYYVATSDYLSTGADYFTPLARYIDKSETGLNIRDLYMEYVERQKDVVAPIDGRMKQL